jgi:hypothetical protein
MKVIVILAPFKKMLNHVIQIYPFIKIMKKVTNLNYRISFEISLVPLNKTILSLINFNKSLASSPTFYDDLIFFISLDIILSAKYFIGSFEF